ncbi:MAG: hypothetical protein VZR28_08505 [Candidatus Cryptobacteroides sp.]|jgi:hypothetical protein|nr:hypothetical protein [Bacteroidales bacterium]MEE3391204.1 hypothetical protein [Candidatus Cryptobacteroides sp.]
MAAIDRLWCSSYEDYKELRDWLKDKSFLSPAGNRIVPIGQMQELSKEDFVNVEIEHKRSVATFSEMVDVWLMLNCPLEWVQEELRSFNYGTSYDDMKVAGMDWFEKVVPSRRNKIVVVKRGPFAFNHPHKSKEKRLLPNKTYQNGWVVEVDSFVYNKKLERFYGNLSGEPWTGLTWDTKKNLSLRSVVRHLRRQGLPTGATVKVSGRFVGEDWELKVL